MKAVVNTRYGSPDVLEIRQVPKPQPKAGEVLVRVHATTVSRTDCGILRAQPLIVRFFMGLRRPKRTILGMDFAGEVEAVGAGVASFMPGEHVFGMSPDDFGAHAEYLCVSEMGAIAAMPKGARFDEAVVCEGAWYADTSLRALCVKPGHRILIYGASGAIGTAAVQLAKSYGAEVTAVVATRHLDLVHSWRDPRCRLHRPGFRARRDVRFCFRRGRKTTFFRCRRLLRPGGVFAATDLGPGCQNPLLAIWSSITGNNRVIFPLPKYSGVFVDSLKARMEARQFRAVIDREYPLEAIADAYRYVETGQKTGVVVINVMPAAEHTHPQPPSIMRQQEP
jgi:NADPH:quinone reductase-like Zn-dependent oxidoreductase